MYKENDIFLSFFGAAGTVTGSKHLLRLGAHNLLIDCGLFQGEDEDILNNETLPVAAETIDFVLLTHAHLDHTGYLPVLVREGFKGKIIATEPTLQLTKIILTDSAKIAADEIHFAKKKRHQQAKEENQNTLEKWQYKQEEVDETVKLFSAANLDEWLTLFNDVFIRFRYNGHILGAAYIEIKYKNKTILFSGDIGRENDLLLYPPNKPEAADILIIESTYGDRLHAENAEEQLAAGINEAEKKNGTIILPAFAVERNQMLMYLLWKMRSKGKIPNLPIYMDSPMASLVLEAFSDYPAWHKLPEKEVTEMLKAIKCVDSIQQTFEIIDNKNPKILIAGSGMVNGGRVLTYLQYYIQDPSTTILLTGFQAKGTNGRLLQDGAKEISIRNEIYKVRATVKTIHGLSGHADRDELIGWLSELTKKPGNVFIVHGEPEASLALQKSLATSYGIQAQIAIRST